MEKLKLEEIKDFLRREGLGRLQMLAEYCYIAATNTEHYNSLYEAVQQAKMKKIEWCGCSSPANGVCKHCGQYECSDCANECRTTIKREVSRG